MSELDGRPGRPDGYDSGIEIQWEVTAHHPKASPNTLNRVFRLFLM